MDTPTNAYRDRRAADLRERAELVRRDGWAPYESTWSSGEVTGVRAVLGEPGAVDEAVAVWAPTLWGVEAAEVDARSSYECTRWWFASVANPKPVELTDTEKARYAAARAASADLRDAIESGDEEGRSAAAGQFLQSLSQLTPEATRDKLHVPDDAGEYRDGLVSILHRIPPNWGRWISCSRGWYPILIELDQALAAIDSSYELHQAKEKYGELRFYFHASEGISEEARDRMDELVGEAETGCETTCELCGEPGALHTNRRSWLKTLCPDCAAESGYERVGELVNDLGPDMSGLWKVTCYAGGGDSFWDLAHGEVTVDGSLHRGAQVLAPPSVLRTWRLRLEDGREIESGLIAAIERIR